MLHGMAGHQPGQGKRLVKPSPIRNRLETSNAAPASVGRLASVNAMLVDRHRELRSLPPGYTVLYDAVVAATETDDRIRGLWLAGSLARGAADVGSDLDVILTVRDDALAEFASGWREWLDSITPTLIAKQLPDMAGSFYSVTTLCERLDVVVEPVSALAGTPYRRRLTVLDRDGLAGRIPDPAPPAGPDGTKIAAIVEEFYRQQTIFPASVVARQDWLLGVVGVQNAQLMLYELFVETNQPLPTVGVKQWSAKLTDGQREVLTSLPVPAPRRTPVIDALLAVRRDFRTHGRRAVLDLGLSWPERLDEAVAAHYRRELNAT